VSFAVDGKNSNLMKENFVDEQFGASSNFKSIVSANAYPSMVMRARNNCIGNMNRRTSMILRAISIEQEEMLGADMPPTQATPAKKTFPS
jgi:hypothetical protein